MVGGLDLGTKIPKLMPPNLSMTHFLHLENVGHSEDGKSGNVSKTIYSCCILWNEMFFVPSFGSILNLSKANLSCIHSRAGNTF